MRSFIPVLRWRSRSAAALLLVGLSGCSSYRHYQPGPEALLSQRRPPHQIEVFRRDARAIKLTEPRLVGDSIIGTHKDTAVVVPLSDVTRVKRRKGDVLESLLLMTGVTVVGMGVGVALTFN